MTSDTVYAPWTGEQVQGLNLFQRVGGFHPFTCGAAHPEGPYPILKATRDGWACPDPTCSYTQNWAPELMVKRGLQLLPPTGATPPPVGNRTPCMESESCDDDTLCSRHDEEQAHAAGEHEYCGVTCEVQFPAEMLYAGIVGLGKPGTKGMLNELLRRAGAVIVQH